MSRITHVAVTGSESPAILSISLPFFWIVDAVSMIDQRMIVVLLPIVGIAVFESSWVGSHEGILRKEKWSTIVESQGQNKSIKSFSVFKKITLCPAAVI